MNAASIVVFLGNHLWQSTLFAGVVAVLVSLLKQNAAKIRFSLWLAASLKFLVPFSVLVTVGNKVASTFDTASVVPVNLSALFESLSRPFVAIPPAAASPWPVVVITIWLVGFFFFAVRGCRHWLTIAGTVRCASVAIASPATAALQKAARILNLHTYLPVVVSDRNIEPGLFGILRPTLVLPHGMEAHLSATQLETVMVHELCHLRRGDNLWAALHTAVQTIFWFHPLVWWLTSRLVDERERACDETVLDHHSERQVYAEALVAICKHYLCPPLRFVSGVTGSTLERRIEAIMTYKAATKLNIRRKLLLAAAAMLTIVGPVLIGVFHAHAIPLLSSRAAPQTPTGRVFEKWLNEDVAYIVSDEERHAFENLSTDEEREHFIEQFWLRRDPTPGTPENEFKDEHFERIAFANNRFGWSQPGWTTDRGRIWIVLGRPHELESHPRANRANTAGGSPTYAYETWTYRYVEGLGNDVKFTFVDPAGTGEYRMLGKFR